MFLCTALPAFASTHPIEQTIAIAKNRLASTKDRIEAIHDLIQIEHQEVIPVLLGWVRNPEEPLFLKREAFEYLSQTKREEATHGLKALLSDTTTSEKSLKLALEILWKRNSENLKPDLIHLATNRDMGASIRAAAISFLGQSHDQSMMSYLSEIERSNENPVAVRIAALFAMSELELATGNFTTPQTVAALTRILQDPYEATFLRKSAVLIAKERLPSKRLEHLLMQILANPQNDTDMRRFSLDHLQARENPSLLPQLRQILQREKDLDLVEALGQFIESLSQTK